MYVLHHANGGKLVRCRQCNSLSMKDATGSGRLCKSTMKDSISGNLRRADEPLT